MVGTDQKLSVPPSDVCNKVHKKTFSCFVCMLVKIYE